MNILARNGGLKSRKPSFYLLKNALVKHLYEKGYCSEAKISIQELPCWGPFGGECDDECRRCGGTGIYRKIILYAFTFLVSGRRFRWHMPESVMDWPVTLTEETHEKFQDPETVQPELSKRQLDWFLLRAWIGCKLAGIDGLPRLKAKGWLRRRIWRRIHRMMGMTGDAFQKANLNKVAWWFYSKRARIWRLGYGE